jgi:hypothetical protein
VIRLVLLAGIMAIAITASSQYRLGVLGSSSANGTPYVPEDSAWRNLVKNYYRESGFIDTLHRIAASTMSCYHGMPTNYIPPPNRPLPNISYNITRLLTRTPQPTHIVVNYPSNGYDSMSTEEILFCLETIRNTANAQGVVCFIATTQPREDVNFFGSYEKRLILKKLRDTIMQHFGAYAIDLWTELADPVTLKRKPQYAYALDLLHLNSAGHRAVARIVQEKDIMNITNIWTGRISNAWEDPGNWSRGSLPTTSQLVVIKPGQYEVVINSDIHLKGLRAEGGTLQLREGKRLDISNQ